MKRIIYPRINGIHWLIPLMVLLIVGLAFREVRQLDFTNWDDPTYVKENSLIRNTSNEGINRMFTEFVSGNYHPLTMLTLAFDYSRGGLKPAVYHETNLILHLLNVLLVFLIFHRLLGGQWFPVILISLFFGLHPMKVESVAWISERKDVLYAFFWLAAWLSYIHYRQSGKVIYLIATHGLFIFSLLSKAMAVTLIPALLLTDFLMNRPWTWRWVKEKAFLLLPAIGAGIVAIFAQKQASAIGAPEDYTAFNQFLVACHGLLFYLWKSILPLNLSAFYPYPPKAEGMLPAIFLIAPLLLLSLMIGIGLLWQRTQFRPLLFGGLFFFTLLFPVLQWLPVGNAIAADRYFYLSSIGFISPIACASLLWIQKSKAIQGLLYGIAALWISWFFYLTQQQVKVWENSITLFTQVSKLYPNIPEPYNNLGIAWGHKGDQRKAIVNYLKVLEIQPNFGLTYNNLGNAYGMLGQYDSAYYYLEKALQLKPSANAWSNMGNSLGMLGRTDEARNAFQKAIEMDPRFHEPYHNLGTSYAMKGDFQTAIPLFLKSIEIMPDYTEAWYSLGITYQYVGNQAESQRCLARAKELGHPGVK